MCCPLPPMSYVLRHSFSGDIPDPPGQGPVQPALGDPDLEGGLDQMTHRGPCQPPPFCDSERHHASACPAIPLRHRICRVACQVCSKKDLLSA